ncbi:MAG: DUF4139 domain-containing protein, partial [Gemmatimonadota bacterium]|nr:DUF4139 domain-containing protein [Gemmatimonadota bacterium]
MIRSVLLVLVLSATFMAPHARAEVRVTVYNNDLALVKESRSVHLPSGEGEFSFVDVAARIDPTSVRLDGGGLTILEQNFRYDLVSREKLLARYLDQPITVMTRHDRFHEGVLKTASGSIVLETADGVVAISSDEVADMTFPEIPEGLITRPTLVWRVENDGPRNAEIEVAYLTSGISWHAEYVAAVDAKDEKMELTAWVSVENRSGAAYADAKVKVVAGEVNRVRDATGPPAAQPMLRLMGKAADFEERSFFEYHIYELGRATTLADREVKQIELLGGREVSVRKKYVYEPRRSGDGIQVRLEFENTLDNGLGIPLPGGKFRIYREDSDGQLEFVGEDRLDHTPRDEEISVVVGDAFDLVGERKELESKQIS